MKKGDSLKTNVSSAEDDENATRGRKCRQNGEMMKTRGSEGSMAPHRKTQKEDDGDSGKVGGGMGHQPKKGSITSRCNHKKENKVTTVVYLL